MYWASKAAENGDIDSQVSLAYAYQNGIGVKKNKKLSFAMYEKAAEQGNQEAIKEMTRVGLMTEEEAMKDIEKALKKEK